MYKTLSTRARGFTLVEIMVAVAIVAILGAVGLPMYSQFVTQSKIPAGLDALSSVSSRLEQYYQDPSTGNYGTDGTCGNGMLMPTPTNFMTVTCVVTAVNGVPNQGFTATVTGTSGGPLEGYSYSINHRNQRATLSHPKGANATCWTIGGTKCDS